MFVSRSDSGFKEVVVWLERSAAASAAERSNPSECNVRVVLGIGYVTQR